LSLLILMPENIPLIPEIIGQISHYYFLQYVAKLIVQTTLNFPQNSVDRRRLQILF